MENKELIDDDSNTINHNDRRNIIDFLKKSIIG